MNADRLLALYDRVSEAPDAVTRLRRFVLDLAVRGKLVEQDPTDEPASELLKRIAAEKARLVKAKEIRKPKPSAPISESEHPVRLPAQWKAVRLIDIGALRGGMTPSKIRQEYWDGDIVWLSPKDIKTEEVVDSELKITAKGLGDTRLELFPPGSLFMVARSGILKRTFPVAINRVPAASNQDLKVLVPFLPGLERYLQMMFRGLTDYILANLVKPGTTVQSLRYAEFEVQPFPIPPLAEQQRIVAKVDELMALLDQFEAARTEREATRDRLTNASLARLTTPETDDKSFRAHACFALEMLPALSARPEQITQLRKSILDLAVRGKLVPRDPSDEPASAQLRRIAEEKAQMVKEGKLKKPRLKSPNRSGGLPFDLPAGWQAAPVEQAIVELQTGPFGSALHQSDYQAGGIPIINPASIHNEQIKPMAKMAVGLDVYGKLATFKLRAGDIILARRGEMGRCAAVTEKEHGWLCGTGCLVLRTSTEVYGRFLVMLIGSPYVRKYLAGSAVGSTMQNLNQGILLSLIVGVPPFAEQQRIVAKVDELMALCDQLENQLVVRSSCSQQLLESLLNESLRPPASEARVAKLSRHSRHPI